MAALRDIGAVVLGAAVGFALARAGIGGGASVGAGIASLLLLLGARWAPVRALAGAGCAALAAGALRWAVVATLAPAYPERSAWLAGPLVTAAVVALVVSWSAIDARPQRPAVDARRS